MNLKNLNIQYHTSLNPDIWNGYEMQEDVRRHLIMVGDTFVDFLKIDPGMVQDYTLTGSLANYNWTSLSDLDLHVIVDMSYYKANCPELYKEYFQAKKKIWNDTRQITVRGYPVELYPQDRDEYHAAKGVYSVLNAKWLIVPTYDPPEIDDQDVKKKAQEYMNLIDHYLNDGCDNYQELDNMKAKIRKLRQSGVEQGGEFSVENLAFKTLRNTGYLEKLHQCYENARDNLLSLD